MKRRTDIVTLCAPAVSSPHDIHPARRALAHHSSVFSFVATMAPPNFSLRLSCLLALSVFLSVNGFAGFVNPIDRIKKDYLALTRRVTARHILLPSDELCFTLKQRIRNQVVDKNRFVVDVFEQAARKWSRDETTNYRGGLLGELVPQGYCRSAELDRACFQVRLGEIEGPIESEYGYHIVLVTERTNCPRLDGSKTKMIRNLETNEPMFIRGEQVGAPTTKMITDGAGYFVFTLFAGGILAELAAALTERLGAL